MAHGKRPHATIAPGDMGDTNGTATVPAGQKPQARGSNHRWDWREWVDHFRRIGCPSKASEEVGIALRTAYDRRKIDPEFAAAWKSAKQEQRERLKSTAIMRCLHGDRAPDFRCVAETEFQDGKTTIKKKHYEQIGETVRFPDGLTVFMLKCLWPEECSETAIRARALEGEEEDQLQALASSELRGMSEEGIEALKTFLRERRKLADSRVADAGVDSEGVPYTANLESNGQQ